MRKEQTREIERANSNAEGSFALSSLPAGTYSLILESRGFAKREVPVNLKESEIASFDVCLDVGILHEPHTPSTISGVVKHRNGIPLSGALVKVINPFDQRVVSSGRTGVSGRYSLEVYLGGQYVVLVHKPGFNVAAAPIVLWDYKSLNFSVSPVSHFSK
jgi:hypothetical protein